MIADKTTRSWTPMVRGRWLFATVVEEPRARRATDILTLGVTAIALTALAVLAEPPTVVEGAVSTIFGVFPSGFDGIWRLLIDALVAWSVFLVVIIAVRRRFSLTRDLVVAALVSMGLASVLHRMVIGAWPTSWHWWHQAASPAWYPATTLAMATAVVVVARPHLSAPNRRLGRVLVGLATFAVLALQSFSVGGTLGALLVAVLAAAVVHVVAGSVEGRPSLDDVALALTALGVEATQLGAADRQPAGLFTVDAIDPAGQPLIVKVYGRDANDTTALSILWRRLWYREPGSVAAIGRVRKVEHEAFVSLFAERAGIATDSVVTAGVTAERDAVLVLRPVGTLFEVADHPWTPDTVEAAWSALGQLHALGIAHGQVDDSRLVLANDSTSATSVGISGFGAATIAPEQHQLLTDRAQLLVSVALGEGVEAAITSALRAIGPTGIEAVLPFVQLPALTTRQRTLIREQSFDLDELLDAAAAAADVEAPELQQLRRVTWASVGQTALLVFVFSVLVSAASSIDFDQLTGELANAAWWLVAVGAIVAQLPRVAQSFSLLGASPTPLPLRPVYYLQLAQSYIGLAVPSSAARVAVNVRFFQRQGLSSGSAVAIGAIDGFAGFVVQALLLVSILTLTPASLDIDFGATSLPSLRTILLAMVGIGIVVGGVSMLVPDRRRQVVEWVRRFLDEGIAAVRGLRSFRRLALLLGGNLGSEVFFATALGLFAAAFGYHVGLTELLLINVSVALLSGLLPIPGGIGVTEAGLTFGLVSVGLPQEAAFAAVISYRIASYYVPPVWGFFALSWLERNKYL
jgi:uncharacterized protein (TIRG00374 family)